MIHRNLLCTLIFLSIPTAAPSDERIKTVPADSFQMGCSTGDSECADDEGPAGGIKVHIPAFRIDTYEVTVDKYKVCVAAGNCTEPKTSQDNKYCNYGNAERGQHPVNCIDWQQAFDYCTAQGGRLPSEAEWEKAARAGATSRYPWGQEVSCNQAILDDGATFGSVPNEPDGCGEDRTWPVGSRAANKLGLFDMHGNAGEWVMNWYAPDALSRLYGAGDLLGPASGRQRGVRGGSWDESRNNLRSSFRNVKPPVQGGSIYGSIGFRCAYQQVKSL